MIPHDYISAWKRLKGLLDLNVVRVDTARMVIEDIETIDEALDELFNVTREPEQTQP